jgi:hypothetical protein
MLRPLAVAVALAVLLLSTPASAQRARNAGAGQAQAVISGPLARHFPADTFLYVEVGNLRSAAEQLGGTDVVYRIFADFLASSGTATKPVPTLTPEQFREMLDSSMAVGARIPASAAGAATSVDPTLFGILRTRSPEVAEMARRFVEDAGRTGAPGKASVKTIRGVRIATYSAARPKDSFSLGTVGNELVFGTPSGVADVLAIAADPAAKRLADVPGYASASNRVPSGRQLFAYLNGGPMVRAFNEGIDSEMRLAGANGKPGRVKPEAAALKRFLGVDAISGGSVSALAESGNLTIHAALELDFAKPGLVTTLADPPPLSMRAAALLPSNTDLMVATSVDLVRIYDLVLSALTPEVANGLGIPAPPAALAEFEAKTGLKFRDEFLTAIGSEFVFGMVVDRPSGIARVSQEATPSAPKPRPVLFVEVRDPVTLGVAVAKLAGDNGAAPEMSTHRETPIWTAGTVAWTILEGFAVIGEPRDVRACIDAAVTGDVLARTASYEATVGTAPNNAITAVYASPEFFEWLAKSNSVPADVPDVGRAFPSGVFYAVQKDSGGVYTHFQIGLPNLRLLFEKEKEGEVGMR